MNQSNNKMCFELQIVSGQNEKTLWNCLIIHEIQNEQNDGVCVGCLSREGVRQKMLRTRKVANFLAHQLSASKMNC